MGSACSTDEETRHHRENKKNRNNPTEPYDTWQPKMLLDIGADPLAVIRDFPRMIVYVGTAAHHNYLPAGCNAGEAGVKPAAPSRRTSENPLAPSHGHDGANAAAAAAGGGTGGGTITNGGRPSQREPFRQDDAFANRMRRVREEVLLLSELCNERTTFGAAFEAAWDRIVAQSTHDGGAESEAASEYLTALQQPPTDGRPPAPPKRHVRNALPLDVHQTLLNACVESGMIAQVEETTHTAPASTTLRVNTAAAAAPAAAAVPHTRTSPFAQSHLSRPDSVTASPLHLPETAGLLSDETPADYGANEKTTHGKSKSAARRSAAEKENVVKSSSTSQIRSVPSQPASGAAPGVAPSTSSRYVVRSATFHLMQFATQGVMFFPVQRLKHVLWVPWGSHMQDVSWTIHYTLKDATAADLIALKQHTLNALYNNASTVLAAEGGLAGESSTHRAAAAKLAASRPSTAADETADAFGAAATTSVPSDADLRATTTSAAVAAAAEHGTKRKIIVIQHVQTGRHHVDSADRKSTPRYELDWACSMRVDQNTLQEAFAPFRAAAQVHTPQASPLLGETANSAPSSHMRRGFKSDEEVGGDAVQRGATEDGGMGGESEGLRVGQLPGLLQREVVTATVEVIAARVERPPQTMCMVSSTWKKRKEELNYVLEQQYDVHLEETEELHAKQLY